VSAGPALPADPHADQPLARAGAPLAAARAAAILVHGRGATAESILTLAAELDVPGVAYLAPQARGRSWYPLSFLAPPEENEPGLSSGLTRLVRLVGDLGAAGLPAERVALLGFSQGACLVLEFAARHPRRYGAVIGLTGGLQGPRGTPRSYRGSFAGTPVLLGAGDPDPHVPWWRVEETGEVFARLGAAVTLRRYPGLPHTVNGDEIEQARALLESLTGASPPAGERPASGPQRRD
jgi:phospholipase/carboxylesterase